MALKSIEKKILFATRPIAPPWDESSKNMVFEIAKRLESFPSTLLTFKKANGMPTPPNVTWKRIYSPMASHVIPLDQKLVFLAAIINDTASIIHFYFSPEVLSSRVIRFIKKFKKGVFLQTIPTPIKNTADPNKLIFGDEIVVQSRHTLAFLKNRGVKNVSCIYPGVDTNRFHPDVSSRELRRRLNIGAEQKVILYPGHYYLGCNRDIVEAISRLTRRYSNLKFILACRITHSSEYRLKQTMLDDLEREKVMDRVIVLQTVENMPELLSASDIVLFPPRIMTRKSDIPLVLLEALSMEKPIVITDAPPLPEIMKDDVGETVPLGDPEALSKGVGRLLDDPELTKIKGRRGRELVRREFDIRASVSKYHNLYHAILRRHKP